MNAFRVHECLIADHLSLTGGFVEIRDERMAAHVEEQAVSGARWSATPQKYSQHAPNSPPPAGTTPSCA